MSCRCRLTRGSLRGRRLLACREQQGDGRQRRRGLADVLQKITPRFGFALGDILRGLIVAECMMSSALNR